MNQKAIRIACVPLILACAIALPACGDKAGQAEEDIVVSAWTEASSDAVCILRIVDKKSGDSYNTPLLQDRKTSAGKDNDYTVSWKDGKAVLTTPEGKKVAMWEDAADKKSEISWHAVSDYDNRGVLNTELADTAEQQEGEQQ